MSEKKYREPNCKYLMRARTHWSLNWDWMCIEGKKKLFIDPIVCIGCDNYEAVEISKKTEQKKDDLKMKKKLVLDLDGFFDEFPSTKYDIGGLGHKIIINIKDKKKAIDEMVDEYRKDLEDCFEEEEDEEE